LVESLPEYKKATKIPAAQLQTSEKAVVQPLKAVS
jgi:hypothetical protein